MNLRCPDCVWVVIEYDVVPGGVLNLNSTNLTRPWLSRESSSSRKISLFYETIRNPIIKRFWFRNLARLLGSLSERFRGVIQYLQQKPGEYFKTKTSRHFYYISGSLHMARYINRCSSYSPRKVNVFHLGKNHKQGRPCTYSAALRRFRVTIFDVEKQLLLHILRMPTYSLTCPARNANAPYCNEFPYRTHAIFSHFLKNCTIFDKMFCKVKYVLWFPLQRLSETFDILRSSEGNVIKEEYRSSCKVPIILVRL